VPARATRNLLSLRDVPSLVLTCPDGACYSLKNPLANSWRRAETNAAALSILHGKTFHSIVQPSQEGGVCACATRSFPSYQDFYQDSFKLSLPDLVTMSRAMSPVSESQAR
jgi:hypothetical protein